MPIRQYFLWVGSILLVALFVADWVLPVPITRPHLEIPPNERVNLQIRSKHKWPEPIVFDTARSGLPLGAAVAPQLDGDPNQVLAQTKQRSPLDAFAAIEVVRATPTATSDKASATRAKPRPLVSRIARTGKTD